MFDKKGCGERLRWLRKAKEKTQDEVSIEVGISADTIRKLEQGRRAPSVEIICILAKYYETTIDYIILGVTQPGYGYNEKLSNLSKEQRIKLEKIIDDIKGLIS